MISNELMVQIANLDVTELKNQDSAYQLNIIDQLLDEYLDGLNKVAKITPAYENIKEYGMTDSICDTYKDMLWDVAEFDIEPYRNAPYAQLSYCIEGLGAVIRKIYQVLRNVIWRIKDWFMVEGFTSRWFNACERHRATCEKLRSLVLNHAKTFDSRAFMGKSVRSYDCARWLEQVNAASSIIASLISVTANADQISIWQNFMTTHNQDLAKLHAQCFNTKINVSVVNDFVVGTTDALQWRYNSVQVLGEKIFNVLKKGLELKAKIYMFERMITQSERNISDVLTGHKDPEVIRDQNTMNCLRMFVKVSQLTYDKMNQLSIAWEAVAKAYLASCADYKPGIFGV